MTLIADINSITDILDMADVLQKEADKHNVINVFDDGGYRELLLTKTFGLVTIPGRNGDDAIDPETGNQYELKTVNLIDTRGDIRTRPSVTTCHHVNNEIIRRYRSVSAFIVGIFYINNPVRIYEVAPSDLEHYFEDWENQLSPTKEHINNPKIKFDDILDVGTLHYRNPEYDVYFETMSDNPRIYKEIKRDLHDALKAIKQKEMEEASEEISDGI